MHVKVSILGVLYLELTVHNGFMWRETSFTNLLELIFKKNENLVPV